MAVRGVYSQDEQDIMKDFARRAASYVGWTGEHASQDLPYPVVRREASAEIVRQMAKAVDPWNPLWSDPQYANETRWGGIIAPPFFPRLICHGGSGWLRLKVPEHMGTVHTYVGDDWEVSQQVFVGDSFRVWHAEPELTDVTDEDGSGNRKFRVLANHLQFYNQRNEVVAVLRRYFGEELLSQSLPAPDNGVEPFQDHSYSPEELDLIERVAREEEVRGRAIRYWEDVQPGEELRPVVHGPLSAWDLMVGLMSVGFDYRPLRVFREAHLDGIVDPLTGVAEHHLAVHIADHGSHIFGNSRAALVSSVAQSYLARLVTNWMGDDGCLRKFSWEMGEVVLRGDTLIGRGMVVRKYEAAGEHLVDLSLWSESMVKKRRLHETKATVALVSREESS